MSLLKPKVSEEPDSFRTAAGRAAASLDGLGFGSRLQILCLSPDTTHLYIYIYTSSYIYIYIYIHM